MYLNREYLGLKLLPQCFLYRDFGAQVYHQEVHGPLGDLQLARPVG